MSLTLLRTIPVPDSAQSSFDHGAVEPRSGRVFLAHTGKDRVEVLAAETMTHAATLPGFAHAAGVVADDGEVVVANRGAASVAWVDARSLATKAVIETGPRPNGVAFYAPKRLAVVACIGDERAGPTLHALRLGTGERWSIDLPGRPRWCVIDAEGSCVFLAIREPSMVLVAALPRLDEIRRWPLPAGGAHGMDIDRESRCLYVGCDDGRLVEVDATTGGATADWALAGAPDAIFFNPASGLVHAAIEEPGLVQSIDPGSGEIATVETAPGAKTTALVAPDRLYVFSPRHQGALVFAGA